MNGRVTVQEFHWLNTNYSSHAYVLLKMYLLSCEWHRLHQQYINVTHQIAFVLFFAGGVTWKKAVGLQFKANRKNKIFPPNRKYIRPAPCDTGMTKSKGSPNLTPHQHKDIRGMDINQATKTLTKLSKINPSLKGVFFVRKNRMAFNHVFSLKYSEPLL